MGLTIHHQMSIVVVGGSSSEECTQHLNEAATAQLREYAMHVLYGVLDS